MNTINKKQNIHGIIIYSKDPEFRSRNSQFIVNERRYGDFHDLFMDADFIFCRKLSEIKKITAKYKYTVLIIDWLDAKEPLSKLREYVKDFPGYHNTSYKHFTYIRTQMKNNDLRLFLRDLPLTMLGDGSLLSEKQTKIGTTLITEVFGAGINHPALMKFFDFYHKREYKKAYEIAKVFHDRYPTREIIFVLFQSASLSLDYIEEKDVLGRQVVAFLPASSKLGFLNHKADLIQARNLYKQGRSEEARDRFKNILEQIGGYKEDAIENILLYILDKFRVVSSYTYEEDDYKLLLNYMKVLIKLEPSMSLRNLRFEEITFNDINKSMFNCRLGLELAILSNVVAYYCSDIGNYKMAAKLYGAAWCFIYNDKKMGLVTLKNLRKAYKNLDDRVNVGIVDKEIAKLKNNSNLIEKAS